MSSLKEQATHVSNLKGKIVMFASRPSGPETGDVYFNTTNKTIERYTGTQWEGILLTTTSTSTSTTTSTSTSA